MIGRIWKTRVDPDRANEYERFAREISLPMFRQQAGFRGVVMLRNGDEASVITFWEDEDAVAALARSQTYLTTVDRILDQGFLLDPQTVEVFEVHLSALSALPEC